MCSPFLSPACCGKRPYGQIPACELLVQTPASWGPGKKRRRGGPPLQVPHVPGWPVFTLRHLSRPKNTLGSDARLCVFAFDAHAGGLIQWPGRPVAGARISKSESAAARNPWGWPPHWVSPAFFLGSLSLPYPVFY